MIGTILTYSGEALSALDAPDLAKVLELFKQQNDILRLALTSCVIVPEGTKLETLSRKVPSED